MNRRKRALTLPEMLTTLTIMVVVGAIALPTINSLQEAFKGKGNTQAIAARVIQNARAIAINEGQYAGVRFQKDKNGRQHAIYILYMPQGSGVTQTQTMMYKSVEGKSPVPMPENMMVADMVVGSTGTYLYHSRNFRHFDKDDVEVESSMTDITSFSIIFNPQGQLVRVACRMRNRHGLYKPNDGGAGGDSNDRIFNSVVNVEEGIAQFVQDDYANLGLGGELSRIQFKIFDLNKFERLDTSQKKFDYLDGLPYLRVNQFTGQLGVIDE